jgi:hypothetical protein
VPPDRSTWARLSKAVTRAGHTLALLLESRAALARAGLLLREPKRMRRAWVSLVPSRAYKLDQGTCRLQQSCYHEKDSLVSQVQVQALVTIWRCQALNMLLLLL